MTHPPKYILTGNTYYHRNTIKKAGGRWNPVQKHWTLSIGGHGSPHTLRNLRRCGVKVTRAN